MAGAELWPRVQADFGVSDTQLEGDVPEPEVAGPSAAASSQTGVAEGTTYSLSFTASYELDLWGRVRSARKAAGADLRATREDLYTMAMTISGEIATAWYEFVEAGLQLELLAEQVKINKAYLELLELQFKPVRHKMVLFLQTSNFCGRVKSPFNDNGERFIVFF